MHFSLHMYICIHIYTFLFTEQASLLAFLTSGKVGHLSAEKNVLTDSELDRWSEMQKTNPEMILSGELLDQALQLVKEDDPEEISGRDLDQLTDQELESLVAERRDLLQAQEIEVEQSEKLLEGKGIFYQPL